MNYGNLWNTLTRRIVAEKLLKYGHILKWKNSKAHVLDMGCGDGFVTNNILYPHVKEHIEKLTGVDISQNLINYAVKHNKLHNIDFRVMDAIDDDQAEKMKGKFDHIFSFFVAHWVPDHRTFLNQFRKMLKPGGQIFVIHIARCPISDSFRRHFNEGTWSKYLPHERPFIHCTDEPAEYIRKIMEDVGFKVEICEHEMRKDPIENALDFTKSIISLYQYLDKIPQELQEEYFEDHLKFVVKNSTYLREPDVYEWPIETLTCIASKQM